MTIATHWVISIAPRPRAAFASWLRGKRHNDKQAHKAELHEWENEGGNLAPSEAPGTLMTTGSARRFLRRTR